MVEKLNYIFKELQITEPSEFNFQESLKRRKIINEKFDALLSNWIQSIKMGRTIPIEKILMIIDKEENRRKLLGEYANPKRNNSLDIIHGFRKKLRQCEFEIAKKDKEITENENECECEIRLKYQLAPEEQKLKKYGLASYGHGEEYLIYECKFCQRKWIEANNGGGGIFIRNWIEWKNDDYRLKQIFSGQDK